MDDAQDLTEDQLWSAVDHAHMPQRAELLHKSTDRWYWRGAYQDAASTGLGAAAGVVAANVTAAECFTVTAVAGPPNVEKVYNARESADA